MNNYRLILKNFLFVPSSLVMPIAGELTIVIGENRAQSKIYSNNDRFFIILIGDDFESDLLYEGQ